MTKVERLVAEFIYEDFPDWEGLCLSLVDEGFTDSQVFNICYDVRQGGTGYLGKDFELSY